MPSSKYLLIKTQHYFFRLHTVFNTLPKHCCFDSFVFYCLFTYKHYNWKMICCAKTILLLIQNVRVGFYISRHLMQNMADLQPVIMLSCCAFLQMRRRSYWRSWLIGSPYRCQIFTTICPTCSTMKAACTPLYRWARGVLEVSKITICCHSLEL